MGFVLMMLLMLVFPLRILRAAMLTQPPVTEVEEVRGLVHSKLLTAENDPLKFQRRESGDSINLTGTDMRRPSRQTCT